MKQHQLCFFLHSHLPYVLGHGDWPHGMDWIYEASAETYIPLLNIMKKLIEEGISPNITFGITPILAEQLSHPVFKDGFKNYLKKRIQAAEQDEKEFAGLKDEAFLPLARMWKRFYEDNYFSFTSVYNEDLLGAFKKLQDENHIEIITCAATHGYLPLLGNDACVNAQVKQGVETYRKHFGKEPAGFWLPECAYRPAYPWKPAVGKNKDRSSVRKGVEEFLSKHGLKYFIVDTHLLKGGKTLGTYLDRFPMLEDVWKQSEKAHKALPDDDKKTQHELYFVQGSLPGKEVAIFTRDPETAMQVWSKDQGYPGDQWYIDFHKKRFPSGLRYWRVTSSNSDLGSKMIYEPKNVENRLKENAFHFVEIAKRVARNYESQSGKTGIICVPFDSELFGHWWFEGPRWLYYVIKTMNSEKEIKLSTGINALKSNPPGKMVKLPEGSWGQGGFHWVWFNDWTSWTWKYIYEAEDEMEGLYSRMKNKTELSERVMHQLGVVLLLLESSDWQFLITTWSARDYAENRINEHFTDFQRLYKFMEKLNSGLDLSSEEIVFLEKCEKREDVFSNLDPSWWQA